MWAAAGRARAETAARRRLEREGRVRIAPVAAEAAALKRGIEVGARVAAMMAQRGSDGRTERERRERRGDG